MLLSFCSSFPQLFLTNSRIWSHVLCKQLHVCGRNGLLGTRYALAPPYPFIMIIQLMPPP